jgi:hypothetical protein
MSPHGKTIYQKDFDCFFTFIQFSMYLISVPLFGMKKSRLISDTSANPMHSQCLSFADQVDRLSNPLISISYHMSHFDGRLVVSLGWGSASARLPRIDAKLHFVETHRGAMGHRRLCRGMMHIMHNFRENE